MHPVYAFQAACPCRARADSVYLQECLLYVTDLADQVIMDIRPLPRWFVVCSYMVVLYHAPLGGHSVATRPTDTLISALRGLDIAVIASRTSNDRSHCV